MSKAPMKEVPDIRVTNHHLAELVWQEKQRRGHKTMSRTTAELLTERFAQLSMERAQSNAHQAIAQQTGAT